MGLESCSEGSQEREVEGWGRLGRFGEEHLTIAVEGKLELKVQDLLGLLARLSLESLVLIEESNACVFNLGLIDLPCLTEINHDILLLVHHVDGSLLGTIVKTDDTIRDSLSLDHLDPSNLSSAVAMSTTTSLSIDALDVHDSQLVSGYHTTLVKMEPVKFLSLSLIHETLVDR